MNFLIVVDMQNDFITGALGSEEATQIVNNVENKIKNFSGELIFTRDTHPENYLDTREGQYLPVPHCIEGSEGFEICPELLPYTVDATIVNKPTFGSTELIKIIADKTAAAQCEEKDMHFTLVGLCTDICVISNAMLIKASYPESTIIVDSTCCAGVTPATHNNALEAMKMCHIEVI